ncbi:MAG TPA: hypothetical protein VGP05_14535, partial [Pseudonocardia sp.]|nr:hypothetical protein [Pseudonocardia sp.]
MSAPTVPQGTPDIAARPHRDTTFPGRFSSASVGVAPRRAAQAWGPPRPPVAGLPTQVPAQRSAPVPVPAAADPT